MAAGDVADGIRHRHDHQAERQRCHQMPRTADIADLPGHAAGSKNQDTGSDKLSQILPQIPHSSFSFRSLIGVQPMVFYRVLMLL